MTLNANTKPPSTVSALETISILMIAGSVVFNGIKIDGAWAPQFFEQAIAYELAHAK